MEAINLTYKTKRFISKSAPLGLVILAEVLTAIFRTNYSVAFIGPSLAFAVLFYWALYVPDRFGITAAFISGLIADLVFIMPLGSLTLVFTAAYQTVKSLRRFLVQKPFYVVWLGFTVLSAAAHFVLWTIISVMFGTTAAIFPVIINFFFSVALYPFMAEVANLTLRYLIRIKIYE